MDLCAQNSRSVEDDKVASFRIHRPSRQTELLERPDETVRVGSVAEAWSVFLSVGVDLGIVRVQSVGVVGLCVEEVTAMRAVSNKPQHVSQMAAATEQCCRHSQQAAVLSGVRAWYNGRSAGLLVHIVEWHDRVADVNILPKPILVEVVVHGFVPAMAHILPKQQKLQRGKASEER